MDGRRRFWISIEARLLILEIRKQDNISLSRVPGLALFEVRRVRYGKFRKMTR
jgi:hypothetical protein